MGKVKEEFEEIKPNLIKEYLQDKNNVNLMFTGYKAGIKSRDEEVERLTTINEVLHNKCHTLILQQQTDFEEIKKLEDALEEVGNILYIDMDGMGSCEDAREIIRKALNKKISKVTWDLLPEDKKALKESE